MRYSNFLIIILCISCSVNCSYPKISKTSDQLQPFQNNDSNSVSFTLINEELQGSEVTIRVPDKWNKKILMLAHGLRPEEAELSSGFSVKDPFYQELLTRGWIIASTSYRKNGIIFLEAIEDIEILRLYLQEKFGEPEEIYLQGSSMGAAISTLIAEDPELPYTGVLAIGFPRISFLTNSGLNYSFQPQIPVLFLSNQNEKEFPLDYLENLQVNSIKPAFWMIGRDGHCLVNSKETSQAFTALKNYVTTGYIEFSKDGTVEMQPQESKAEIKDNKCFSEIVSIHPSYGNFITEITAADLELLGIEKNSYFKVGHDDRYFRIYYGTTYSDVLKGFWIAFLSAEGYLRIARNFANAAETLHCSLADTIYIEPLSEEEVFVKPYIESGTDAADLGIASWEALISGDPSMAVSLAQKGLAVSPDLLWLQLTLAHAYLFSNEYEKAVEIYERNKGKHVFRGSFYFEDLALEDLAKIDQMNIYNIDLSMINELLSE